MKVLAPQMERAMTVAKHYPQLQQQRRLQHHRLRFEDHCYATLHLHRSLPQVSVKRFDSEIFSHPFIK